MKNRLTLIAILIVLLALVGCTPEPTATPIPPTATPVPPTAVPTDAPAVAQAAPTPLPTVDFAINLAAATERLQVPEGDDVALVNDQPISNDEFTQYMRLRLHTLDAQYPTDWRQEENAPLLDQAALMVLDQLIDMEILRQEAAKMSIEVPSESVEILKTQVISQVLASGEFASWDDYKAELGLEESTVDLVLEDSLLLQELMLIYATPADVPQVHAQHILVESEELAQDLLDQLADGADFAALAAEHSTDPGSAANGGDLGWFPRGMMVPTFEEAAFSLEPGEISEIVPTDYGFHIIKVLEKGNQPLDPALAEQAQMQAFNDWFIGVRAGAEIERLVYADTEIVQ